MRTLPMGTVKDGNDIRDFFWCRWRQEEFRKLHQYNQRIREAREESEMVHLYLLLEQIREA